MASKNTQLRCVDCKGIYFTHCFQLYKNSIGDINEGITEYKCLTCESIYLIDELKELKES